MKNQKQIYIYGIIALVFFVVIAYFISEKKKKDKELEELKSNIISGVGEAQNDVNVSFMGVKAEYYPTVNEDVTKLEAAKGFWNDDENAIYAVISNKSKAQLKGLSDRLETKTGKNLNTWLESVLDAGAEIEHAKLIIRNAK